jgi:hypothetical protein
LKQNGAVQKERAAPDIYLKIPVVIQEEGDEVRFDHTPFEEYCTHTPEAA